MEKKKRNKEQNLPAFFASVYMFFCQKILCVKYSIAILEESIMYPFFFQLFQQEH